MEQFEYKKEVQMVRVPRWILTMFLPIVIATFLALMSTVFALSIGSLKEIDMQVKSDITNLKLVDGNQGVFLGTMSRNIARLCEKFDVKCEEQK